MKSVLISIHPEWCEAIASGKKTIEVRKSAPKEVPFKAYIYCTKEKKQDDIIWAGAFGDRGKWNGHIIGEFICDKVYNLIDAFGGIVFADEKLNQLEPQLFRDMSCLTDEQTENYLGGKDGYGWRISDLKIYDKPKKLWQFYKCGAKTYEELSDSTELCEYCKFPSRGLYLCEGRFCDAAYEAYLDSNFTLTRPPQSWQYVEEVKE